MSDSPFVGPRPFEKEDSDRFFGRTRETEELLSLIIAHRAVLVYAQSGAGKSSLLRAGVIKRLEEQQYQVLRSARVHGLLPNDVPPESVQNIFVYHALQYWAATLPSGQSIKDHAKTTLCEFLKPLVAAPEAGEDGSPPLIVIFDQFEEFFTTNAASMAGTTAIFRSACAGAARFANDEGCLRHARGVHRAAGAIRRVAAGKIATTHALGAVARQLGA